MRMLPPRRCVQSKTIRPAAVIRIAENGRTGHAITAAFTTVKFAAQTNMAIRTPISAMPRAVMGRLFIKRLRGMPPPILPTLWESTISRHQPTCRGLSMDPRLEQSAITAIRTLAIDTVQAANSGHPGAPMGCAPMAHTIWTRHLRHAPSTPGWFDRDRFVLSNGHASALLYSLLHLTGYGLTVDDLKSFRQWGSLTPGHPEYGLTAGVEATTGPLGQGFANGVGMAIAERRLAAEFNRPGHTVVDHRVFAIVSDGDLQEGLASEAASLAGHLKLGKLIYLWDDNLIQLDGPTSTAWSEDVRKRFDAYGWHTSSVADGNDVASIDAAISAAIKDDRPSLIAVRTVIGFGSPNKAGSQKSHGAPLGPDEVKLTKTRVWRKSRCNL